MITIEHLNEKESCEETMMFIMDNRNWDVPSQSYKKPEAKINKINLIDCKIYWRGEYLILECENTVHYWDSYPYCFLQHAIELMELEKPAKWKTAGRLVSLRMGIRQTEVNGMGYVETILEGEKMTLKLYKKFMRFARAQDFRHHGSHTF